MQKMNLCTDGYFLLAVGGFDRCMRGGADKFWRELHREETPRWKNWRPMNEDEIRAEQERKDREARAEIDRRENRTKRDGSHHEFKIKATSQRLRIKTKSEKEEEKRKSFTNGYFHNYQKLKNRSLPKGLYKKDLIIGNFPSASRGDKITINYIGTLKNGKVFHNSFKEKRPISFIIGDGQAISGLDLGIIGMKQGGIRELKIPYTWGFGLKGVGKDFFWEIPPKSTLFYVVELLSIEKDKLR